MYLRESEKKLPDSGYNGRVPKSDTHLSNSWPRARKLKALTPSCSKVIRSDFVYLFGSNHGNGLFQRKEEKKDSEIGLDHVTLSWF